MLASRTLPPMIRFAIGAVVGSAGLWSSGCGPSPETEPTPTAPPESSGQTWPAGASCDGLSADTAVPGFFVDLDGDGFGAQAATCGDSPYLVEARGDCADGDPTRHPGATDTSGDDIDSDCGGSDAPQPSVGISTASRDTLLEALVAAKEGDTVWVGPGTYEESFLSFSGKNIRLLSTRGAEQTVIDGNGTGPILLLTDNESRDAEVRGFTVQNAEVSGQDSAIVVRNASPALREVVVRDGLAAYGGGISLIESAAQLEDVTVLQNYALEAGGGIYIDGGGPELTRTHVYSNLSTMGGGLYVQNAAPALSEVECVGNNAYNQGGNVYLSGVTSTLSSSTLKQGSALRGGGLYLFQSTLSIQDSMVSDNHARSEEETESQGGGIFVDASTLKLQRSDVMNNGAGQGGGLFSYASTLDMDTSTLYGNAARMGGGLFTELTTLTGQSLTLEENSATEDGGGAYLKGAYGTLERLDAHRNRSDASGGGVFFENASLALGAVSLVENQAAQSGGGMASTNTQSLVSTLRISDLHAGWNHAQEGAGVHVQNAMLAVSSALLEGNRAETRGGGVVSDGGGVTLSNARLEGNAGGSGGGGGGVVIGDGVLSMPESEITSNLSSGDGGGVLALGGLLDVTGAMLTGNTASSRGGGIFYDDATTWFTQKELLCSGNYAGLGGCIWTNAQVLRLKASVVMGNQAWDQGGAVFLESSDDADLFGSDLMGNKAAIPQSNDLWWCVGSECCGLTFISDESEFEDNGCANR